MKELSRQYPLWLCDVWGVVHDGHEIHPKAVACLIKHRQNGGKVVFITNSPNVSASVAKYNDHLGVPREASDAMVTSGDATRDLIVHHGGNRIYHIGTPRDYSIFEGLDVTRVDAKEASAIVCSGLFEEEHERPEDYRARLTQLKTQGLTMICANPDKVVRKAGKLVPCAGALAEIYAQIGGRVLMAGKPYAPIYDLARAQVSGFDKSQILAIGDGPQTDVQGAADYGVPCVFITDGINVGADIVARTAKAVPHAKILATMPELDWT